MSKEISQGDVKVYVKPCDIIEKMNQEEERLTYDKIDFTEENTSKKFADQNLRLTTHRLILFNKNKDLRFEWHFDKIKSFKFEERWVIFKGTFPYKIEITQTDDLDSYKYKVKHTDRSDFSKFKEIFVKIFEEKKWVKFKTEKKTKTSKLESTIIDSKKTVGSQPMFDPKDTKNPKKNSVDNQSIIFESMMMTESIISNNSGSRVNTDSNSGSSSTNNTREINLSYEKKPSITEKNSLPNRNRTTKERTGQIDLSNISDLTQAFNNDPIKEESEKLNKPDNTSQISNNMTILENQNISLKKKPNPTNISKDTKKEGKNLAEKMFEKKDLGNRSTAGVIENKVNVKPRTRFVSENLKNVSNKTPVLQNETIEDKESLETGEFYDEVLFESQEFQYTNSTIAEVDSPPKNTEQFRTTQTDSLLGDDRQKQAPKNQIVYENFEEDTNSSKTDDNFTSRLPSGSLARDRRTTFTKDNQKESLKAMHAFKYMEIIGDTAQDYYMRNTRESEGSTIEDKEENLLSRILTDSSGLHYGDKVALRQSLLNFTEKVILDNGQVRSEIERKSTRSRFSFGTNLNSVINGLDLGNTSGDFETSRNTAAVELKKKQFLTMTSIASEENDEEDLGDTKKNFVHYIKAMKEKVDMSSSSDGEEEIEVITKKKSEYKRKMSNNDMTWIRISTTDETGYGQDEENKHDLLKGDHDSIHINLQTIENLLNDFNKMSAPVITNYYEDMYNKVRDQIVRQYSQINCWSIDHYHRIAVFATDQAYHMLCIYWLKDGLIFSTKIENKEKAFFGKKYNYVKPQCIDINDDATLIAVGLESGHIQIFRLTHLNNQCKMVNIGWIKQKQFTSPIIKVTFIRDTYDIFFINAKYQSFLCTIIPDKINKLTIAKKVREKFIQEVNLDPQQDKNQNPQEVPIIDQFIYTFQNAVNNYSVNNINIISYTTSNRIYFYTVSPNIEQIMEINPWKNASEKLILYNKETSKATRDSLNNMSGNAFSIMGLGKKTLNADKFDLWFQIIAGRTISFYIVYYGGDKTGFITQFITQELVKKEILFAKFLSEGVVATIDFDYKVSLFYTEDILKELIPESFRAMPTVLGDKYYEKLTFENKKRDSVKNESLSFLTNVGRNTLRVSNYGVANPEITKSYITDPRDGTIETNFKLHFRLEDLNQLNFDKSIPVTKEVFDIHTSQYHIVAKGSWILIKDKKQFVEFRILEPEEYLQNLTIEGDYQFCLNVLNNLVEGTFTRLSGLYRGIPTSKLIQHTDNFHQVEKQKPYLTVIMNGLITRIRNLIESDNKGKAVDVMRFIMLVLCKSKMTSFLFGDFKTMMKENDLLQEEYGQSLFYMYEKGIIENLEQEVVSEYIDTFSEDKDGQLKKEKFIFDLFERQSIQDESIFNKSEILTQKIAKAADTRHFAFALAAKCDFWTLLCIFSKKVGPQLITYPQDVVHTKMLDIVNDPLFVPGTEKYDKNFMPCKIYCAKIKYFINSVLQKFQLHDTITTVEETDYNCEIIHKLMKWLFNDGKYKGILQVSQNLLFSILDMLFKSRNIWKFMDYHISEHNHCLIDASQCRDILKNPCKDKKISAKNHILTYLYNETNQEIVPFNTRIYNTITRRKKDQPEVKDVLVAIAVMFFKTIQKDDLRQVLTNISMHKSNLSTQDLLDKLETDKDTHYQAKTYCSMQHYLKCGLFMWVLEGAIYSLEQATLSDDYACEMIIFLLKNSVGIARISDIDFETANLTMLIHYQKFKNILDKSVEFNQLLKCNEFEYFRNLMNAESTIDLRRSVDLLKSKISSIPSLADVFFDWLENIREHYPKNLLPILKEELDYFINLNFENLWQIIKIYDIGPIIEMCLEMLAISENKWKLYCRVQSLLAEKDQWNDKVDTRFLIKFFEMTCKYGTENDVLKYLQSNIFPIQDSIHICKEYERKLGEAYLLSRLGRQEEVINIYKAQIKPYYSKIIAWRGNKKQLEYIENLKKIKQIHRLVKQQSDGFELHTQLNSINQWANFVLRFHSHNRLKSNDDQTEVFKNFLKKLFTVFKDKNKMGLLISEFKKCKDGGLIALTDLGSATRFMVIFQTLREFMMQNRNILLNDDYCFEKVYFTEFCKGTIAINDYVSDIENKYAGRLLFLDCMHVHYIDVRRMKPGVHGKIPCCNYCISNIDSKKIKSQLGLDKTKYYQKKFDNKIEGSPPNAPIVGFYDMERDLAPAPSHQTDEISAADNTQNLSVRVKEFDQVYEKINKPYQDNAYEFSNEYDKNTNDLIEEFHTLLFPVDYKMKKEKDQTMQRLRRDTDYRKR